MPVDTLLRLVHVVALRACLKYPGRAAANAAVILSVVKHEGEYRLGGTTQKHLVVGQWLKEPLLHFLLIGAALFVLYAWVNPEALRDENTIIVSQSRLQALSDRFQRAWNRPPTEAERQQLVDNYVLEEIFYRQALALGLDSNDEVIRRRLRQKMELLVADSADLLEPTDAQLTDFLHQHPDRFERDPVFSFEQVYIGDEIPARTLQHHIAELQQQLRTGEQVKGSPSLLPRQFTGVQAFHVNRQFGQSFAAQLLALPLNQWSEPLHSGLGLHLVRVTARQPAYLPSLAEIRGEVKREWQKEKSRQLQASMFDNLKANYTIVIEDHADQTI